MHPVVGFLQNSMLPPPLSPRIELGQEWHEAGDRKYAMNLLSDEYLPLREYRPPPGKTNLGKRVRQVSEYLVNSDLRKLSLARLRSRSGKHCGHSDAAPQLIVATSG